MLDGAPPALVERASDRSLPVDGSLASPPMPVNIHIATALANATAIKEDFESSARFIVKPFDLSRGVPSCGDSRFCARTHEGV